MSVEIKEVKTRSELRAFVNFPEKLYRDNPYYIPPLEFDQLDTLDQKKGAAQQFCDSALYLAYKDGELVGRVAAIVNRLANEQWNHKEVRFGWYDFVEDKEVSKALMDKVEEFGRRYQMDSIVGPLGFTDFDPEGLLIKGFDKEGTMALIYNHPYYVEHIEGMGFQKEIDWYEYRVTIPEQLPERVARVAKVIAQRANVHIRPLTRKIIRKENYGRKIFNAINACYQKLYNFTILPDDMADKYLDFYLTVLDLKFVSMVENEKGELVAFGISMPGLNQALKKSRGKLFPFGWWYLMKSLFLKREDAVELLLIGCLPEYQNQGLTSLITADMFAKYSKAGVKYAESNAVLETNVRSQGQYKDFETEQEKVRRSYIKRIEY